MARDLMRTYCTFAIRPVETLHGVAGMKQMRDIFLVGNRDVSEWIEIDLGATLPISTAEHNAVAQRSQDSD